MKAAQVQKRLKDLAKGDTGLHINEIRVILGLERAIARLVVNRSLEPHIVFKGGFVLLKNYESLRFTRDADALATGISKERLSELVVRALTTDLDDGLWFGDTKIQELNEQGEYGAYRFDFAFQIGIPNTNKIKKLSRLHLDVGFSDKLSKNPDTESMNTLLDYPVTWKVYPIEYIFAEKLQTLLERGSANSRSKDVYDLVYLYPRCNDAKILWDAIKETFKNRNTDLPKSFYQTVDTFDTSILVAGWPGVKIIEDKPLFKKIWDDLKELLQQLDKEKI